MSDDDLLAKLRGLGVDADREKLAGLGDGALSAEEVVSERFRLPDRDADWAWICLTELWQRWWPEKACLELMDDKIQPGKRRAARPYTEWRRVRPLARASGTQGWLGIVRRCAVSGAWWRQMA